jgi:hypothetical protein
MENISRVIIPKRYPQEIKIYPYLYDHHLEGRALYPAAEALNLLARAAKNEFPQADVTKLSNVCFPRFLSISPKLKFMTVSVDIGVSKEGKITAALLSSLKSKTGNISRTVEHARANFGGIPGSKLPANLFRRFEKPEGEYIKIPAVEIYRELVPFGETFQNISGDLSVSRSGAIGYVYGGDTEADDDLLGSSFPFDAVLQIACIWAQRFADAVPFPVGFEKRTIFRKTKKRIRYWGLVEPVAVSSQPFIFNAWIIDMQGSVFEAIKGIQMADVSGGKMKPPVWIKATTA